MPFDGEKKWGGRHEALIDIAASKFRDLVHDMGASLNSESEIEEMLSFAFFANSSLGAYSGMSFEYEAVSWCYPQKWTLEQAFARVIKPGTVYVFPQTEIEGYRADFLCVLRYHPYGIPNAHNIALAVECDGHEFHERTKAQAARDRSRDRILLTHGIPSMRFTGSEVWKDPFVCAQEVDNYFAKVVHRMIAAIDAIEAAERKPSA